MGITKEFEDLLTLMLQPDATQRMSISDILAHPWMKQPMASKDRVKTYFTNEFPHQHARSAMTLHNINEDS